MYLSLVTAPTAEPISIAEARAQLRLDTDNAEPAPPAITVALAGAGAGNVDNGVHRYLATFVTADGETDAGTVSEAVTVADKTVNGKVSLSAIPLGGTLVTSRKLYRTAAGGSTYLLLATLSDNTTTTYTDNIADSALGAQAPTTNTTADTEVLSWIQAARERCEGKTRRAMITQTWDLFLCGFPWERFIELPKPPLKASGGVTSVQYYDTSGTLQTLSASDYTVLAPAGPRCARGRIQLAQSVSWPSTQADRADAVQVRFICGYGASGVYVPAILRSMMKLDVSTFYENREGYREDGKAPSELPIVTETYASYRSYPTQRLDLVPA